MSLNPDHLSDMATAPKKEVEKVHDENKDTTVKEKKVQTKETITSKENQYMKFQKIDLITQIEQLNIEKEKLMYILAQNATNVVNSDKKPKKECLRKNNLKAAFFMLEKYFDINEIKEWEKMKVAIEFMDDEMLNLCIEENMTELKWIDFKNQITKKFIRTITKEEFRNKKQCYDEKIEIWIEEMIKLGKGANEDDESIILTIKNNMRYRYKKELLVQLCNEPNELIKICKKIDILNQNYKKKKDENNKFNESKQQNFRYKKEDDYNQWKKKEEKYKTINTFKGCNVGKSAIGCIEIKGIKEECMFDSGCQINVISESLVKKWNLEKYNDVEFTGELLDGSRKTLSSVVDVTFTLRDKKYQEKFYIMDITNSVFPMIILGFNFLSINKIDIYEYTVKYSFEKKFERLFSKNEVVNSNAIIIDLNIRDDYIVQEPVRRIPFHLHFKTTEKINELISKGYIKESESHYNNPMNPIPKDNGDIRITIDFTELNKLVDKDNYPLPRIDDIIFGLKDARYFSVLDLKDGFYQIPISNKDSYKTAFKFKHKSYEWLRLPMGFKNSPAIFQRIIDTILKEEIGTSCFAYIDDIIVFGVTKEKHDENLERIAKILIHYNIKVNKDKWQFRAKKINFLGFEIMHNRYRILNKTVKKLNFITAPKNRRGLMRITGFLNYFRKFVPNFSSICEPLYALLNQNNKFKWETQHEDALKNIKDILNKRIFINIPNFEKEFILYTDASGYGIGAILMQEENGKELILEYASRSLTKEEKNYGISEKEALAIRWSVEHFEFFLKGKKFKIFTDHKALQFLNENQSKNARIRRWVNELLNYDMQIIYKNGNEMNHVDFLSRLKDEEINCEEILEDDFLVKKYGLKKIQNKHVKKNFFIDKNHVLMNNELFKVRKNLLVKIPEINERKKIIEKAHLDSGHMGFNVVYKNIKDVFYWPGMCKTIENKCKKCQICLKYNVKGVKNYNYVITKSPNEIVAIDLLNPKKGVYIILMIDYYSRYAYGKLVKNKESKEFIEVLKEYIKINGPIKKLVSDNAKELCSKEFEKFCEENNIINHKTAPYHHESNGRVERLNKTILAMIRKKKGDMSKRVTEAILQYNSNYNRSINNSPSNILKLYNELENVDWEYQKNLKSYTTQFDSKEKEKFQITEKVLFKNENKVNKLDVEFLGPGEVIGILENDGYLIRYKGKEIKRNVNQLKSVGEKVIREGDVEVCITS